MRILSGVAGGLIFLVSGIITLGVSLAAPLGVLVGSRLARRKGDSVTRARSWFSAVVASSIAAAIVLSAVMLRSPAGRNVFSAAAATDSARHARLPEWFTRAMPPPAREPRTLTEVVLRSRAGTFYEGLLAVMMMSLVAGAVAGSVGWAATVLCSHAIRGSPKSAVASP